MNDRHDYSYNYRLELLQSLVSLSLDSPDLVVSVIVDEVTGLLLVILSQFGKRSGDFEFEVFHVITGNGLC